MNGKQAGWYPHPGNPGQERYWDGSEWTNLWRPQDKFLTPASSEPTTYYPDPSETAAQHPYAKYLTVKNGETFVSAAQRMKQIFRGVIFTIFGAAVIIMFIDLPLKEAFGIALVGAIIMCIGVVTMWKNFVELRRDMADRDKPF